MKANPVRLGLILGLFLALFNLAWAALVAIGWAQPLMNFIFWAHFITPPYHVEPFALPQAIILISFVFAMGLMWGIVGGWIWNRLAASG